MPLIDLTDTELVHIMDSLRLRVAENDAIPDAAAEFIQAGIDTREQQKATSRAAARRDLRTHTFHIERED